ncbi:MAG: hypothetical protein WCQ21_32425, partial [Verrucomicrobiota bacterium]
MIIASTQGLAQTPGQRPLAMRGGLLFEHPLEAIAESAAAAQEASVLRVAVNSASRDNVLDVAEALEAFAAENPTSAWTPSLRANLGGYYCTEGYWTKALEQWERAWDATKHYPSGTGKRLADFTLAYWTRLLVELGRLDELQVIFAEAEGRNLDGGPLLQKYLRTKELYAMLRQRPEVAYRCGWLVLNQLSQASRGQQLNPRAARELYQERNLLQSCAMSVLAQIALKERWSMVGVERPEGSQDLPIPSVLHLKQGHYMALLRADGNRVLAYDPIFGVRHFRREVLNAETSGRFLLDASSLPAGWRALSAEEMATTVGRSGGGGGGFGGFGDDKEGDCADGTCWDCGDSAGMPQWRVSEPNINLWLRDKPISCQPAYGPAVAFDLEFKQRDEQEHDQDSFNFGPGWNSHWCSQAFFRWWDGGYSKTYLSLPGGGTLLFSFPEGQTLATNYENNCQLTLNLDNGNPSSYVLDFPDGRKYIYSCHWVTADTNYPSASTNHFYLSWAVDQKGFVTGYSYNEVNGGYFGKMLRLAHVVDSQYNILYSLEYTNSSVYSSLVSRVTDRFGRSAELTYANDAWDNVHLTAIRDAAGLLSMISYNAYGWPQTLVTAYGTTTFEYDGSGGHRRVRVHEPNGGSQTYLFTSNSETLWSGAPWMPWMVPDDLMPNNLPEGTMLDQWSFYFLNSFHWNQRQSVGVPTDLSQLTTNHMNKARMRHWLSTDSSAWYVPDVALSLVVAPSPSDDGS